MLINGQKATVAFPGSMDPFRFLSEELELVEKNLRRSIRADERSLTEISSHLIEGGGKRVRPLVTLLSFRAFGGKKLEEAIDIATALELIHTATLLHDDIIDGAETRRGKESAFKRFGLKATLVTGDFLFIKAFEFAGKFDNTIVQWTADACTRLTEGEMIQGLFNRNAGVTLKDYLEIVNRKTASLFETGTKIGAYLAGASPSHVSTLGNYGLNLGIAFQMIDDVLDVVGHKDILGKPTGIDLRDGNPSLPIILALIAGERVVSEAFASWKPSEKEIDGAIEAMGRGTIIEQAKTLSRSYGERALKFLKKLPPSNYRDGLESLVSFIVDRRS